MIHRKKSVLINLAASTMKNNQTKISSGQSGFSLIEVIIALIVLTLALSALIDSASSAASNTTHLQSKAFAHWVALNQMAEFRLAKQWPEIGTQEGKAELADQQWEWKSTTQKTPEKSMRRIDIRVRREGDPKDSSVTLLTGFLRQPNK
ncbi:MAG: type II secretion system protein GspI [Thiothrix sp.]|nr:MAG: type II secretion system protein GspI [Thiothrix sp.]